MIHYNYEYIAATEKFWRCCKYLKDELARIRSLRGSPLRDVTPMTFSQIKTEIRRTGRIRVAGFDHNDMSKETFEEIEHFTMPIGRSSDWRDMDLARQIALYAVDYVSKQIHKTSRKEFEVLRLWARRRITLWIELAKIHMQFRHMVTAEYYLEIAIYRLETLPKEDYKLLVKAYLMLARVGRYTLNFNRSDAVLSKARACLMKALESCEGIVEERAKDCAELKLQADKLFIVTLRARDAYLMKKDRRDQIAAEHKKKEELARSKRI